LRFSPEPRDVRQPHRGGHSQYGSRPSKSPAPKTSQSDSQGNIKEIDLVEAFYAIHQDQCSQSKGSLKKDAIRDTIKLVLRNMDKVNPQGPQDEDGDPDSYSYPEDEEEDNPLADS
jgi:hypothetical protein